MPDLILNTDSKQYQDLAADFASNEIAPRAHQFDESGEFPLELCKKAWEIGLVNPRMPETLGGLALGVFDAAVMAEELGAGCVGITSALWGNDLAVAPLLVAGTTQQQEKFLAPAAEQFQLFGYAFNNPSAGGVTCKKSGEGFTVTGSAICINAKNAPWILVVTRGENGESVFVVETATPGVAATKERVPGVGLKASDIRIVNFENVQISQQNLIGTAGSGADIMNRARTKNYPVLASYIAGLMRSALEHSVRYSKERHTMGQPIANHQAVGFMLADMAKDLEAVRFMVRKAAWLADHEGGHLAQSVMAKNFACDAAVRATIDAVQVFGGYGYSREYPVEKLMRDAKMMQMYEYQGAQDNMLVGQQLVASAV